MRKVLIYCLISIFFSSMGFSKESYKDVYDTALKLFEEKKYPEAWETYQKFLKLMPPEILKEHEKFISDKDRVIKELENDKKQEEALKEASDALKVNPFMIFQRKQRAINYFADKKYDEGLKDINILLAFYSNDKDANDFLNVLYLRGCAYIDCQKYKEAINDFDEVIKKSLSPIVDLYLYRGFANQSLNNFDSAIMDYTKGLELFPDNTRLLIGRGSLYSIKMDMDNARLDFEKACQLGECRGIKKYDEDQKYAQAVKFLNEEKYEQAWNAYQEYRNTIDPEQLKKIDKFSSGVFSNGSKIWESNNKNKHDEVIEIFTKGLYVNPFMLEIRELRASSYYSLRRYDEALKDLEIIIGFKAKNEDFHNYTYCHVLLLQGSIYGEQGKKDLAIEKFNQALGFIENEMKVDPKAKCQEFKGFIYSNRGDFWLKTGQFDKAIEDYTKGIASNLTGLSLTQLFYNRGVSFLNKKDMEHARLDFAKACDLGDCSGLKLLEKEEGGQTAVSNGTGTSKEFQLFLKLARSLPADEVNKVHFSKKEVNGVGTLTIGGAEVYTNNGSLTGVKVPHAISNALTQLTKSGGYTIHMDLDFPFIFWLQNMANQNNYFNEGTEEGVRALMVINILNTGIKYGKIMDTQNLISSFLETL